MRLNVLGTLVLTVRHHTLVALLLGIRAAAANLLAALAENWSRRTDGRTCAGAYLVHFRHNLVLVLFLQQSYVEMWPLITQRTTLETLIGEKVTPKKNKSPQEIYIQGQSSGAQSTI
jgi:hypothetical protein